MIMVKKSGLPQFLLAIIANYQIFFEEVAVSKVTVIDGNIVLGMPLKSSASDSLINLNSLLPHNASL